MREPLWDDGKIREEARNINISIDKRWMAEKVLENMRKDYQARIDELESTLAEHDGDVMYSNMSVRNSPAVPAKRMPKHATAIFHLAFGDVDAKVIEGEIVLTSDGMPVAVHPHSANKVSVVVEERDR